MTADRSRSLRFAAARATGSTAAGLSRITGRGSGTTIGGRVTLLVDPQAMHRAAAGRELALVSGTNGKTTTRSLLVAALATLGPVLSNSGGANLPTGLTAALTGDRTSTRGVLEVDEPFMPLVVSQVSPRVAVLLNLSRDQLDRYAEVRRLAGIWRTAITGPGSEQLEIIANVDDPLVVWAVGSSAKVTWVAAGQRWTMDSTACPECGLVLTRSDGHWSCSSCGLSRPSPSWSVADRQIAAPDGSSYAVNLSLPGDVNIGNAAMAAAAAAQWGVRPEAALRAMERIESVEGRYSEREIKGRTVRLLLAKNPAGWVESLSMVRPGAPVVVAVNARAADGRDPSWLWDAPFESLAGRSAIATGERSRDVAVRLRYASIEQRRIDDAGMALEAAIDQAAVDSPVEVLANYTAFQTFHRLIGAIGG